MLDSHEYAFTLRMVEEVLFWVWDPIGVNYDLRPRSEYNSYAPTILGLLLKGKTVQEVADALNNIAQERMELHRPENSMAAAEMLVKWFTHQRE